MGAPLGRSSRRAFCRVNFVFVGKKSEEKFPSSTKTRFPLFLSSI